ncbi:MAG TPA: protein kinase, partial [Pyrinomonadaceae bacterium]
MPLSAGDQLGRYEIRSQIGAGGMGEVYRAYDPKINRDVAIKVLPFEFSADAERLRRFEQEAQAAGALNHPNVLAIFDVETHEGAPYVVSELLEGETLREQMGGSVLSIRRAVDYALQVARGLAAAHEKGIVHRDLKPENIFITSDERVKILDFGLAKLSEQNDGAGFSTDLPTRKINTDPGTVMGTIGYMSPEQVRGRGVDHRTDIFAFGCVLYEMLAGKRAFRGETPADTISAILKEDPPELSLTNKQVAPGLERIVRHCLEKAPANRFQTARDLAFALESISTISGGTTAIEQPRETAESSVTSAKQTLPRREWVAWGLAALFLIAAATFAALYLRQTHPRAEVVRFTIAPPEKTTYDESFALSPDGRRLVFVVTGEGGETTLIVRALDSTAAQQLSGTEGAKFPFWSPDGRYIAFFAANKLKKIEATGGPAQTLAEVSTDARGGAWGPDGTILFAPTVTQPLYKVSAAGGAASPVTELDQTRGQTSHRWPWFLPDGRHFIYFSRSNPQDSEGLYVGALDSKETKFLLNTKLRGAYVPSASGGKGGHLLFVRDNTLVAQAFDADKLQLSGEPLTVAEGVLSYPTDAGPTAYASFSVSSNGYLSYLLGSAKITHLTWFDRAGKTLGSIAAQGTYSEPRFSPDGERVVAPREDVAGSDLWMIDITRGTTTRFTFDPKPDVSPVWSPDGSRVAFSSARGGKHWLYHKLSSGAGNDELLLQTASDAFPDDWSPDGRFILYEMNAGTKTRFDLWVLPTFGDRQPFPFLQSEFDETHAQFSPDGRFVTYVSNESGRAEVYVQSFPGPGGKWQVSMAGGDQPQWRRDGKELFYIAPDKTLVAVPVTASDSFETGTPVALFRTRVPTTALTDERNNYVVSPDGKRFLISNLLEEGNTQPVTLVLNWEA